MMNSSRARKSRAARTAASLLLVVAPSVLVSAVSFAECRVDEPRAYLSGLRVSASDSSFSVGLEGVPIQILPAAGAAEARVEVLAPLRFTASFPAAELRYRIARAVDLYGGRVRIGEGAMPKWLGVRGNALLASLAESLQVSIEQPLRVPCSHLALNDGKSAYATPAPIEPPAGLGAGTGAGPIPLHLFPVAMDPIVVQYPGPYAIESRQRGWVLLQASWADGSHLRGWTREELTTAEPEPPGGSVEAVTHPDICGRADAPLLTPFTVRRGAPIAAAPAGAAWAWTAEKLSVHAFPLDRADGWIRIGAVAGLASAACTEHDHLWVHVKDLIWPRVPMNSSPR
jgi:hypothetical protein